MMVVDKSINVFVKNILTAFARLGWYNFSVVGVSLG